MSSATSPGICCSSEPSTTIATREAERGGGVLASRGRAAAVTPKPVAVAAHDSTSSATGLRIVTSVKMKVQEVSKRSPPPGGCRCLCPRRPRACGMTPSLLLAP
eukprot:6953889-Prymnesium_polylepis.1